LKQLLLLIELKGGGGSRRSSGVGVGFQIGDFCFVPGLFGKDQDFFELKGLAGVWGGGKLTDRRTGFVPLVHRKCSKPSTKQRMMGEHYVGVGQVWRAIVKTSEIIGRKRGGAESSGSPELISIRNIERGEAERMMFIAILFLLSTCFTHAEPICAGCPMPQDANEYQAIGKSTFERLQAINQGTLLGHFRSIDKVKTQVVAGTFYTFELLSTFGEKIKVKLFKSLPDNGTPRKFSFEVSFAEKIQSPLHNTDNGDLVVTADDDLGEKTSLETRGASWTETVVESPGNV
jgi:hypothetical protein